MRSAVASKILQVCIARTDWRAFNRLLPPLPERVGVEVHLALLKPGEREVARKNKPLAIPRSGAGPAELPWKFPPNLEEARCGNCDSDPRRPRGHLSIPRARLPALAWRARTKPHLRFQRFLFLAFVGAWGEPRALLLLISLLSFSSLSPLSLLPDV